jgi:hypothetical protein
MVVARGPCDRVLLECGLDAVCFGITGRSQD